MCVVFVCIFMCECMCALVHVEAWNCRPQLLVTWLKQVITVDLVSLIPASLLATSSGHPHVCLTSAGVMTGATAGCLSTWCWRCSSSPHICHQMLYPPSSLSSLPYVHSSFLVELRSYQFDSTTGITPKKTSFVLGVMVHTYNSYLKCRSLRILNFRSGLHYTVRLSQLERKKKERKKKLCNCGGNLFTKPTC